MACSEQQFIVELFRKYLEVDEDPEEDMDWEKLYDKRTRCVFLLNGVDSYSETIRSKIFRVQDMELLESLRLALTNICGMYKNFSDQYSKTKVVNYVENMRYINPNLKTHR